jgi:tyrosine-specific transport protein
MELGTWAVYLLLLYALTAAYLAGTGPMISDVIYDCIGYRLPQYAQTLPCLILFGGCVYLGTQVVDYINRVLMVGLAVSYFFLISGAYSHVDPVFLSRVDLSSVWMAIPVISTSYGFHIIIPTLTTYLDRDVKSLKRVILIGSAVPLIVYLLWEYVVLGVVPAENLKEALRLGEGATRSLGAAVKTSWIEIGGKNFAFFAIITSLLGVGLSLFHFFVDALKIKQDVKGKAIITFLTFIVPVGFVLFFPRGFIMALEYAGFFVALLLGVLPIIMVWKGRKIFTNSLYRVSGGKTLLTTLLLCFLSVLILMIKEVF